jgi:hypothetical protein
VLIAANGFSRADRVKTPFHLDVEVKRPMHPATADADRNVTDSEHQLPPGPTEPMTCPVNGF